MHTSSSRLHSARETIITVVSMVAIAIPSFTISSLAFHDRQAASAALRPHVIRPHDTSVRCTGPLVPVYGSSAALRLIVQEAQDFCAAQITGQAGTPYAGHPVDPGSAIDVEYLTGDRTDHGGASIPCLNGSMSVGSTMVHGLAAPTGCNDPAQASYSCSPTHCYSINQWYSSTGYYAAAKTTMVVSHLFAQGNTCDHINAEEWLSDFQGGHDYWVEEGLTSGNDCVGGYCPIVTCYFWEDNRPGSSLIGHVMGAAQSSDWGNQATFQIASSGSGVWTVDVWAPSQHDSDQSTSNSMSPNNIEIGGEVAGTSGASAPTTYSQWNTYNTGGGSQYFNSDGTPHVQGPPWAGYWDPPPSQEGGSARWYIGCCR